MRPLRRLTGAIEFNELFFNDVEVPQGNLVGGLNCGWQVAMATLMNERGGTGLAARQTQGRRAMVQLARVLAAHGQPLPKDPGSGSG